MKGAHLAASPHDTTYCFMDLHHSVTTSGRFTDGRSWALRATYVAMLTPLLFG